MPLNEMNSKIEIFDEYFCINGKIFTREPTLNEISDIFGASRITKPLGPAAKSDIYTYDKEGVWVYVENQKVTQISILLSEPYLDFHPVTAYNGVIEINGKYISNADDFLSVESKEVDLIEWEAEGCVGIELKQIHCGLTGDYESKTIEDISFWYES